MFSAILLQEPNNTMNKKEFDSIAKRFDKVVFKEVDSNYREHEAAKDVVSSFKLDPLEDIPEEAPTEFTTPGFNGEFGDGTEAKGDGIV